MSQALKILIVEDESIVAMDLSMRLQHEGYEIIGVADNSDEAVELFKADTPDLVLMDINIKGSKDGIETAILLKKIIEVPLIFLTAFSQNEYIDRAKEVNPAAYLIKPFNAEGLMAAIQIAIHNFALIKSPANKKAETTDDGKGPIMFFNNFFFVKNNYRFNKIAIADFLFAESDNNYIKLVTKDSNTLIRVSLQYFTDYLKHSHLVRVHRGFVINIQNIDSFNEEEIQIGKHLIPIGKAYKDSFIESFNYL